MASEYISEKGQFHIYSGGDLLLTDDGGFLIDKLSQEISELTYRLDYLVPWETSDIKSFLENNQAVVVLHEGELAGFCKLQVHPGEDEEGDTVVEISTVFISPVFSGNGLGSKIVTSGAQLWEQKYRASKLIAVVAETNDPSNTMFRDKLGWELIERPSNVEVKPNIPGNKCFYCYKSD